MHKPKLILLHGRGGTAADILRLRPYLGAEDWEVVAPQAPGGSWYPDRFIAPFENNQPYLDRALQLINELQGEALLGFSQGACLALEVASRYPRKYRAILALTGGLIGPPGTQWPGDSLDGTPIYLSSPDPDGHVPFARVQESAQVLQARGAQVEVQRLPGAAHQIYPQQLQAAREYLQRSQS
jgi:phospholipase/carboxylesterase